jgi:hypothetical protein
VLEVLGVTKGFQRANGFAAEIFPLVPSQGPANIPPQLWRKPVLRDELGQKVSEVLIVDACHNRYPCEFTTSLFYLVYVPHFQ